MREKKNLAKQSLRLSAITFRIEADVQLRALLLNQTLPSASKPSLSHLPLLLRLRDEIAITAMSSSVQLAASRFGLQEDLVMETIHDFVSQVEKDRDCTLFPYQTYEMFTQTTGNDEETRAVEAKEMQAGEDPLLKSSDNGPAATPPVEFKPGDMSTRRKIKAVKAFCKAKNQAEFAQTSQIPMHQLLRWKEKIHKVLFQDEHADHMISVKPIFQDNFLKEAEEIVFKWYTNKQANISNPAEAIRLKASKIARIEDLTPNVSRRWVASFMQRRKIEPAREIIDCDKD